MSKPLIAILVFALSLRLMFWAFGADVVWPDPYRSADTAWYVDSAMNLVDHGTYTSDFENPDAFFSRPPGYSLFWSLFYLVFGEERAYVVTALVQVALDVVTVYLIFLVVRFAAMSHRAGLVGALLYAAYPFAIVWTTLSLPDTLANFLTLAFVATLLSAREHPWRWIATGALYSACILTREYLGLLGVMVPIIAYCSVPKVRKVLMLCMLFGVPAVVIYAGWPVRNILNHGEAIVFRVEGSASPAYQADARAAIAWLSAWTNLPEKYTQMIKSENSEIDFPAHVFADDAERKFAQHVALRARHCGESFNVSKGVTTVADPCTDEVAQGFERLLASHKSRHPLEYWIRVPTQNLAKTVFKSSLVRPPTGALAQLAQRAAFACRSILLALGIVAVFVYRRNTRLIAVFAACLLLYLFFAFVVRHVQMRYLLQADILMLTLAASLTDRIAPANEPCPIRP